MAGLVPATHVFAAHSVARQKAVDGRDKPGHGEEKMYRRVGCILPSAAKFPRTTCAFAQMPTSPRKRGEVISPRLPSFVEPDIFEAPAIVLAVGHQGQPFEL